VLNDHVQPLGQILTAGGLQHSRTTRHVDSHMWL
jgi:hypothetical protein